MISLKRIYKSLFFAGIFFLPFNSYEGIRALGEFSIDSCVIFFLLSTVLVLVDSLIKGKIHIPIKNPIFILLLFLLGWFLISSLLNLNDIKSYYFKQTSGLNRFVRQYLSLMISSVILLFSYYSVMVKENALILFYQIRKVIFMSFVVVSIYTIIEILIIKFECIALVPILELFNYFPFTDVYIDFRNERISSVTFEPPAFATYLFTIAGWMFSYILTGKGIKRYVPAIMTIIFALFSGSRAALLIIFLQAIIFLALLLNKKYIRIFLNITKYTFIVVFLVLLFKGESISNYVVEKATSFEIQDDIHAVSNKSRFGIQYTLFQVFFKKPIIGTGYGQQTFLAKDMYPKWATDDNWEFRLKYLNEELKSFPPGYNIYLRVLAESGLIGFIIFILFLASVIYVSFKIIRQNNHNQVISLVILVSIVGFIFNWFKMDTFRVYGFWISFALLLHISNGKINFKSLINR